MDQKKYFYNLNNYSDSEITKFIIDFTKLDPLLLILLNKDFANTYLKELDLEDEYSIKTDDYFGDLIESEIIEKDTNILIRIYEFSDGLYKIKEERVKFENLNYTKHLNMSKKIQDFQYCIHKIISTENSRLTSENFSKTTNNLENEKNPFPLIFVNLEVYKCFEEYTKKHILEVYSDYSYLKKRLEKEKLIHYQKDNEFIDFLLYQAKLITEKDKENYYGKYESKLKSLTKSYNVNRENNFNKVFADLI